MIALLWCFAQLPGPYSALKYLGGFSKIALLPPSKLFAMTIELVCSDAFFN